MLKITWFSAFFRVLPLCKVTPVGLEPTTQWLRVICSTNWATESFLLVLHRGFELLSLPFCECKVTTFFLFYQIFLQLFLFFLFFHLYFPILIYLKNVLSLRYLRFATKIWIIFFSNFPTSIPRRILMNATANWAPSSIVLSTARLPTPDRVWNSAVRLQKLIICSRNIPPTVIFPPSWMRLEQDSAIYLH